MAGISDAVRNLAAFSAIEDILLAVLRPKLADVQVKTLIATGQTFPMVLVRRTDQYGEWSGDPRFIDTATVAVQCYAEDPDGDADAEVLSQAVRSALRASINEVVPDLGHLVYVDMIRAPRRAPDWASAVGPVQYADLPSGVHRYETVYDLTFRSPT
ncbi:MAG: hypothetical protein ACRCYU_12220 [Nocardioides sp.]